MKCYCEDPSDKMPDYIKHYSVSHWTGKKMDIAFFVVLRCETCEAIYIERDAQ